MIPTSDTPPAGSRVRPRGQGDSGDPQARCGDRRGEPDARGHRSENRRVETGSGSGRRVDDAPVRVSTPTSCRVIYCRQHSVLMTLALRPIDSATGRGSSAPQAT